MVRVVSATFVTLALAAPELVWPALMTIMGGLYMTALWVVMSEEIPRKNAVDVPPIGGYVGATPTGNDQRETPMSVTFFAVDNTGNEPTVLRDANLNVTVSNSNAIRIERWLGFRPADDDDIPGGERTIAQFQVALLSAVLRGESMGEYASVLGELCAAAVVARAERILWA